MKIMKVIILFSTSLSLAMASRFRDRINPCSTVRCGFETVCRVVAGQAQCVPNETSEVSCAAVTCLEGTVCQIKPPRCRGCSPYAQCVPVSNEAASEEEQEEDGLMPVTPPDQKPPRCPLGEVFRGAQCKPVTCESEKACDEGEVCVPRSCGFLRGRFRSACQEFECRPHPCASATCPADMICQEKFTEDCGGFGGCEPWTCVCPDGMGLDEESRTCVNKSSAPNDGDGATSDCGDNYEQDSNGRCVPVNCKAADACPEDGICEDLDIECVTTPCIKYSCMVIDCLPGSRFDREKRTCVPITCDYEYACKEAYTCVDSPKECVTEPCIQYECIRPDEELPEPKPEPEPLPEPECRDGYVWYPDAWTCVPITCEAPDACLGGTCKADEDRRCIASPCPQFDCECPADTHQYDIITGHCVPINCKAEDACTGEGETCEELAQLCADTRPCKQYYCAREDGDEEPPPCKPGYFYDGRECVPADDPLACKRGEYWNDFNQRCEKEPCAECAEQGLACIPDEDCMVNCPVKCVEKPDDRIECKRDEYWNDFNQRCEPEPCAECAKQGLACIPDADCMGDCPVKCVENACISAICGPDTVCQISTECDDELQETDVCAKCVPYSIVSPPLPMNPCATMLCPKGTRCQPTRDCKGFGDGDICGECVPQGDPEPLSCQDEFACEPGTICLEGFSDALPIWCYPDPCISATCLQGQDCRATKDVKCDPDTPLGGDCPPVQAECFDPMGDEPKSGGGDAEEPKEEPVDGDTPVVSILCAEGFELDSLTDECVAVTCKAEPCDEGEECVDASIECVRAPCQRYLCQPV